MATKKHKRHRRYRCETAGSLGWSDAEPPVQENRHLNGTHRPIDFVLPGQLWITPCLKWESIRMPDGFQPEIYIQIGPIEVSWSRLLHVQDFSHCSILEPRKILVREKNLLLADQQPDAVCGYPGDLNSRRADAKLFGNNVGSPLLSFQLLSIGCAIAHWRQPFLFIYKMPLAFLWAVLPVTRKIHKRNSWH